MHVPAGDRRLSWGRQRSVRPSTSIHHESPEVHSNGQLMPAPGMSCRMSPASGDSSSWQIACLCLNWAETRNLPRAKYPHVFHEVRRREGPRRHTPPRHRQFPRRRLSSHRIEPALSQGRIIRVTAKQCLVSDGRAVACPESKPKIHPRRDGTRSVRRDVTTRLQMRLLTDQQALSGHVLRIVNATCSRRGHQSTKAMRSA